MWSTTLRNVVIGLVIGAAAGCGDDGEPQPATPTRTARVALPTPTRPAPGDMGAACQADSDCDSEICDNAICCREACAPNEVCRGPHWSCVPLPVTATPTRLPATPFPTGTRPPHPPSLLVRAQATGPGIGELEVRLQLEYTEIAAVENEIRFPPGITVLPRSDGRPDCQVNPEIDKAATTFGFLPAGCAFSWTCIKAIVISFDNVDPIAAGEMLYTCRVLVLDGIEPGHHPLPCTDARAAHPSGFGYSIDCFSGGITVVESPTPTVPIPRPFTPTPTRTGELPPTPADGTRTPTPTPGAGIQLSDEFGPPGTDVSIRAVLARSAGNVVGIENEIHFHPLAPIARNSRGRPDCQVNPEIDKTASAFSFLSDTRVKAIVLAIDNLDPIPDGAELYRCRVHIEAGDHPVGYYSLWCFEAGASDANGSALPIDCRAGSVTVTRGG